MTEQNIDGMFRGDHNHDNNYNHNHDHHISPRLPHFTTFRVSTTQVTEKLLTIFHNANSSLSLHVT